MEDPRTILMQYVTGKIQDWDVIAWAHEMLEQSLQTPNEDMHRLVGIDPVDDPNVRNSIISRLIAQIPGADAMTPDRMQIEHDARRLLDRSINPLTFCRTVWKVDAKVLDAERDYPEWLERLWNACDWCDETWSLDNAPELKSTVETLFADPKNRRNPPSAR